MIIFKKQLKRILGFLSISVLLTSIVTGILTKASSFRIGSDQTSKQDYHFERQEIPNLNTEAERPTIICRDLLEEDENNLVFKELSNVEVVECMFIGCGGIF